MTKIMTVLHLIVIESQPEMAAEALNVTWKFSSCLGGKALGFTGSLHVQ